MKIGVVLTLEIFNTDANSYEKYRCKIMDKNNEHIFIDYPVHMKTKKTEVFRIGTRLSAEYIGEDQSVYRFKTIVLHRRKGKIPTLALQVPSKDEIKRIQRREYVRVDTAVDVAIHSKKESFSPFTTVSVDLSGGGLSVIIPKGVQMEEKEDIHVNLVLPMHSGDYNYLNLNGEVVRVLQNDFSANTASIKLLSLSEQDKQAIIRYCFEKQREARQKEMQ